MIVFDLKCADGHVFEEWFASSADYEAKQAAHAVSCPECGDTGISKALMAPRVAVGDLKLSSETSCGMSECAPCGCEMADLD